MARLGKNSATGRAIYLGAIIAMVGILAGMAVAATFNFTVLNLGQGQNYYTTSSGSAPGYGTSGSTASVNANFVPTGISACNTPFTTVDGDTNAATTVVVLSYNSVSPTTSCAALDWAEEFNISFSENFGASSGGFQTNNVTVVTMIGGASAPTTNSIYVMMGDATTGSAFTQDLQVYVDYGTGSAPPPTGISALELEIH